MRQSSSLSTPPLPAGASFTTRDSGQGAGARRGNAPAPGSKSQQGGVDLNLLVVFDAVMQERSLTRAGRRIGLSQPATSHAVARLRRMLQDDLFIRTPEGMQPTPRALQMADSVHEALQVLNLTLEPETFDPRQADRSFILAVNSHAARAVVPGLARAVAETAPRIGLDVRPLNRADALAQLDNGDIDLALSTLSDGGERFKCVRLLEDDYVAVLDLQHPAVREASLSAERLAEIPHISVTSDEDTSFIDASLAEHGLCRRIATRVPFLSIVLMLVGSNRIAILPRRVAVDLARICPVAVRDLPFPSPRIALSMIWHRRVDNLPAQRWLREAIRSSLRAG
jgi:DNA-binding transcriptional LysR family regulator